MASKDTADLFSLNSHYATHACTHQLWFWTCDFNFCICFLIQKIDMLVHKIVANVNAHLQTCHILNIFTEFSLFQISSWQRKKEWKLRARLGLETYTARISVILKMTSDWLFLACSCSTRCNPPRWAKAWKLSGEQVGMVVALHIWMDQESESGGGWHSAYFV